MKKRLPLLALLGLLSAVAFLVLNRNEPEPPAPSVIVEPQPVQTEATPSVIEVEAPVSSTPALRKTIPTPAHPGYQFRAASKDGTGKFFLGREISHVMGHQAISWLERSNRPAEEDPDKALALLDLPVDTVIADIGAGSGYHTFRLAKMLPRGEVIAVDIQPEMLTFLTEKRQKLGVNNVRTQLGTVKSVNLPAGSIDAALMVDAYHEFSYPFEMARSLYQALRPGGQIFLLEYRAEDPQIPIKPLHKMTEAQAIAEWETAGFQHVGTKPDLPWQHLLVFQKPSI